jgi:hypothetical protein
MIWVEIFQSILKSIINFLNKNKMKQIKFLSTVLLAGLLLTACSKDNDTPEQAHEEELITTLKVTLTPSGGGTAILMEYKDLDGEGSDTPVVSVSNNLAAGVTYDGVIEVSNETEDPAEDITEEVKEENLEHQFFYTSGGGLDVTTSYSDSDDDGNDLGIEFTLTAGAASSGTLTFTLRHEPTKPNTGLSDAGGETDIAATFDVTIE